MIAIIWYCRLRSFDENQIRPDQPYAFSVFYQEKYGRRFSVLSSCTCGNNGGAIDEDTGKPFGFFLDESNFNGEPVTTVKVTIGAGAVQMSYPRGIICGKCGSVINSREQLWSFSELVELILTQHDAKHPWQSHAEYEAFRERLENYVWETRRGRRRVTRQAKCFRRYTIEEAARRIPEEIFGLNGQTE